MARVAESPRSCATWHSRIHCLFPVVAEIRKRMAQVRICARVPNRLLFGDALRLSNERFQVVDANIHNPVGHKSMSEIAMLPHHLVELSEDPKRL